MPLDVVWNLADSFNALMTIPNLIAVLLLSGLVARETDYYLTENNLDKVDGTPMEMFTSSSDIDSNADDSDITTEDIIY